MAVTGKFLSQLNRVIRRNPWSVSVYRYSTGDGINTAVQDSNTVVCSFTGSIGRVNRERLEGKSRVEGVISETLYILILDTPTRDVQHGDYISASCTESGETARFRVLNRLEMAQILLERVE